MTKYKYLRKNGLFISFSGDSNLFVMTVAVLRANTSQVINEGSDCCQFIEGGEVLGYVQFYPKESKIKLWGDKLIRKGLKSRSLRTVFTTRI